MTAHFPNLSGQQDVYASPSSGAGPRGPAGATADTELTVLLERGPGALLRVFGVLCTFELVPEHTASGVDGPDMIRVAFRFAGLSPARCDLLARKLAQLTECIDVSVPVPGVIARTA